MNLFGLTIERRRKGADVVTTVPPSVIVGPRGWWPVLREQFAGAWQRSITVPLQDAATYPTFWACLTLIASDIAKLRPMLVQEDPKTGICDEVNNPAYSGVLDEPNHYQHRIQFYEYWALSKLSRGNTYVLKERNHRGGTNQGNVDALYLLDPTRVQPAVAPNGDVYYALQKDPLSRLPDASVYVPASEIIHDRMNALYHPLIGLSPIYACATSSMLGLKIIHNTSEFAAHGSMIGGILTAPQTISNETAERIQRNWEENYAGTHNAGRVAVLGDGLKFDSPKVMSAVDAQLIDQLKWGDERICSTFHVPSYMVGVGPLPLNNNVEALSQQYYSQCLQVLLESIEMGLSKGLELTQRLKIKFDLEGLLRMDSVAAMAYATSGVKGGILTPNEARERFNLKPLKGGDTVYLQQQEFSIAALDARDQANPAPSSASGMAAPKPESVPAPAPEPKPEPAPAPKGLTKAQRKALVIGRTVQVMADAA